MKITETHKNGSAITIQGVWGVQKVLKAWRDRQDGIEPDPVEEPPKVTGLGGGAQIAGSADRSFEHYSKTRQMPVVDAKAIKFGFQPNE